MYKPGILMYSVFTVLTVAVLCQPVLLPSRHRWAGSGAWKLRARSPCYSCPGLAAHHRPVVSSCRGPRAPGRRRSKPGPWSDSESGPGPVRGVRQLSCDRQYPGSAVPEREAWQRQQLSTSDCRSSTVRAVWQHWQGVSRLLVLWGEHARRSVVRGRP